MLEILFLIINLLFNYKSKEIIEIKIFGLNKYILNNIHYKFKNHIKNNNNDIYFNITKIKSRTQKIIFMHKQNKSYRFEEDITYNNIIHFVYNNILNQIIHIKNKKELLSVNKLYDRLYYFYNSKIPNKNIENKLLFIKKKYPYINLYKLRLNNFNKEIINYKCLKQLERLKNNIKNNDIYNNNYYNVTNFTTNSYYYKNIYDYLFNNTKEYNSIFLIAKSILNKNDDNVFNVNYNINFNLDYKLINKKIKSNEYYFISYNLLKYFKNNEQTFIIFIYNIIDKAILSKIKDIYLRYTIKYNDNNITPILYLNSNKISLYKILLLLNINTYENNTFYLIKYNRKYKHYQIINKTNSLDNFSIFEFLQFINTNHNNLNKSKFKNIITNQILNISIPSITYLINNFKNSIIIVCLNDNIYCIRKIEYIKYITKSTKINIFTLKNKSLLYYYFNNKKYILMINKQGAIKRLKIYEKNILPIINIHVI